MLETRTYRSDRKPVKERLSRNGAFTSGKPGLPFGKKQEMGKYREGETIYFVANHVLIKSAVIVKPQGDRYIINIKKGGAVSLPEKRLFRTMEEAEESIRGTKQQIRGNRNPHVWRS